MNHQIKYRRLALLWVLVSAILSGHAATAEGKIYLVRHAEKILDGSRDPALTSAGEARAHWLAAYFKDKDLRRIFSTDYARTRGTAMPTANDHDLDLTPYNPDDLAAFAAELAPLQGPTLVVGHSNTTPILAGLLLGEEYEELDERVYDHIYVVTIANNGAPSLKIEYSEPRTVLEVAELKSAIEARLGVMREVAHYKWANKLPIEAPEREEAVLRATVTQAATLGIGVREAEKAVKAQMRASKLLQAAYFEAWETTPPEGVVPDLKGSLRPRISVLTDTFLKSLKAAKPHLQACHTAATLLYTDMTTTEAWQAATAALLPEGGCS